MATGTIPLNRFVSEDVFTSTTTDVHAATGENPVSVQLNKSSEIFSMLLLTLHLGGTAGGRRGGLLIPCAPQNTPMDFPVYSYGTGGYVRVTVNGTTLSFTGCSFTNSLYLTHVYALR